MTETAAVVFALFAALLVGFQIALALGAPWGHLAMGGRWPGRYPVHVRLMAILQGALMVGFAWVVLAHAGLIVQNTVPGWAIWVVLAFSSLGAVLNLITPSLAERKLWGPVALAMLACVLLVIFA